MTKDSKYVSRGGYKLEAAFKNFKFKIKNCVALDVGSSTGGFVDCLLQNGAAKVYSVDTSYGELAWKLRQDPRVVVMERTNILHLNSLPVIPISSPIPLVISNKERDLRDFSSATRNDNQKTEKNKIPEIAETSELVDLITIDASWTKLELILPVVAKFLKPNGQIIALLKPHYQADKKLLVKGVLPVEYLDQIKNDVLLKIKNLNFKIIGDIPSPILGGGGNQEYLLLISN